MAAPEAAAQAQVRAPDANGEAAQGHAGSVGEERRGEGRGGEGGKEGGEGMKEGAVGRFLRKRFGGRLFLGRVCLYDQDEDWYQVSAYYHSASH